MSLLFALLLLALAWGLGALQLWPRTRWMGAVLPWLGGALALAFFACLGLGVVGLVRGGGWGSPSVAQAVHGLLGEGSWLMRRSEWAGLNRAANVYLNLDLAWTLLALCFASLHGFAFWASVAEQQRQARVRAARAQTR
ncbi:hypothetical protein [Luteimonas kalidii]|uniref:Uncharacterized protein n=1 Tax=Luteimonas kalidii TaxID=3042025 RepID=A0ABT6JQA4_9GAMM|nr:hypothetical protein [Luteimonas kalidii]MDH5832850.1 hypothetical protein [Luteimonas kalidii]